jgi:hypothetical protein
MTVINGIEIDDINFKVNELKLALNNNNPLEDKLNVIVVISNPCLYARRYQLFNKIVNKLNEDTFIRLYVVELAYKNQKFIVTNSNDKNHLQIRTDTPLWHKENMINIAVKKLLPKNYKAFAWIDADIEFESNTWALDTLKILNGYKDVVQLFSHAVDMDHDESTLNIFSSFGYSFSKHKKFKPGKINDYWHPGFAWAITRKSYEKMGGLYEKGILGSGDNIMAYSFINKCIHYNNSKYSDDYNNSMLEFQERSKHLRLGYVPGVIRHYYHGKKKNRYYHERTEILAKHQFSPQTDITYDFNGIIIPTNNFSQEFKDDIMNYFFERKEDE